MYVLILHPPIQFVKIYFQRFDFQINSKQHSFHFRLRKNAGQSSDCLAFRRPFLHFRQDAAPGISPKLTINDQVFSSFHTSMLIQRMITMPAFVRDQMTQGVKNFPVQS